LIYQITKDPIFFYSMCTFDRHVEVLSTPPCLKDTSFEISPLYIGYACDQQVAEISTPLRLKI